VSDLGSKRFLKNNFTHKNNLSNVRRIILSDLGSNLEFLNYLKLIRKIPEIFI